MRKRYLIANWKLNVPPETIGIYLHALAAAKESDVNLVVAPPFPYLKHMAETAPPRVSIGAQNCAEHIKGAFTGEVSGDMIRDCGAQFVIIGHSERRNIFHETDAMIARKLTAAIAAALTPVLCIGEDVRTRDAGHVARFLAEQIKAAGAAALDSGGEVIIAYEPIWAIGTGRNASGAMVAETVEWIREALARFWPERYVREAPILYGGSVTPENIDDLERDGNIEGYLVGGASLDSERFLGILGRM